MTFLDERNCFPCPKYRQSFPLVDILSAAISAPSFRLMFEWTPVTPPACFMPFLSNRRLYALPHGSARRVTIPLISMEDLFW